MLSAENFTAGHIMEIRENRKVDPAILERSIYALGLLEALVKVGMPFIFKGGTGIMLLTDRPRRLSTDIDIIVEPGTDIQEMLDDLTNKKADDAGKVAEVLIDGNSGFKKGDSFSGAKAEVVIRYHSIPAEKQSQVKIDENFKGKQVDIVLDTLGKLNFENVLAVPLGDLESSTDKKNGQVESVTCGGAVMKKGEYYSPGEETIIRYHSVSDAALAEETRHAEERQGKIVMPQSASKYCGKDYEKVEAEMRALGFTKITLVSVNDTKSFEIWNKGR